MVLSPYGGHAWAPVRCGLESGHTQEQVALLLQGIEAVIGLALQAMHSLSMACYATAPACSACELANGSACVSDGPACLGRKRLKL